MGILGQLVELMLPQNCAVCAVDGAALCPTCTALLADGGFARRLDAGVVVHSAAEWDERTAAILRGVKEDGRTALLRPLGAALACVVRRAAPPGMRVLIVPVPSRSTALRRRGFSVVGLMLRRAGLPAADILRFTRTVVDQRGLGRQERQRNLRGAVRLAGAVPKPCDGVLLVDDVVTTGATLSAAAQAFGGASVRVLGAATVLTTRAENSSGFNR